MSDIDWLDINNTADKTQHHSQIRFSPNAGMQKPSPHTLECYDVTSNKCHNGYPSHGNGVLPPCGNFPSNTQTNPTKCNIYFARATRDPTPLKMSSFVGGQQEKPSFCSSKWTKFMPNSSAQNQSCDTLAENSLLHSITPDNKYNDNSGCDRDLILPSQQGNKSKDRQCNSLLVQDLFKVDDDLDEEWWNSSWYIDCFISHFRSFKGACITGIGSTVYLYRLNGKFLVANIFNIVRVYTDSPSTRLGHVKVNARTNQKMILSHWNIFQTKNIAMCLCILGRVFTRHVASARLNASPWKEKSLNLELVQELLCLRWFCLARAWKPCILKASTVECQSIPLIVPQSTSSSTLNWHSSDIPIDSWSTFN